MPQTPKLAKKALLPPRECDKTKATTINAKNTLKRALPLSMVNIKLRKLALKPAKLSLLSKICVTNKPTPKAIAISK